MRATAAVNANAQRMTRPGDAISVADALRIAVLNQFIETPHYGYASQL
jgi:hypothetical protein